MKKLILLFFCISFFLPFCAPRLSAQDLMQDAFFDPKEYEEDEDALKEEPEKEFTFARQAFEFGFNVGVGFDNNLLGTADILTSNIIIDLNELNSRINDDGVNINFNVDTDLFIKFSNIDIASGVWSFGFSAGAEGNINTNLPKSLFTLITAGNINENMRSSRGDITASGGIFMNAGISTSAQYGKLRIGVKPSLFSPIVFIPRSGIRYQLDTNDSVSLSTSGEISIYSPLTEDGFDINELRFGFDLGVEGEFALLSFLDVGGGIYSIPIVPAAMESRLLLSMSDMEFNVSGTDLMNGEEISLPELEFSSEYGREKLNIFRPLRFEVYAKVKPLQTGILTMILIPSAGFSVEINNEKGHFNFGLDTYTTLLKELIKIRLGTNYQESIWKHRLGLGFNIRAFELAAEATLRSSSFAGSFSAQGLGLNIGMRFGW